MDKRNIKRDALLFIVLMGIVSLFSDITHEGASSIIGAFLSLTGASAAAIGFVSGLGECVGYSLRLLSGLITDKTKKYWPMTIAGYILDCAAIPALALVPQNGWFWACLLIVVQRFGKAVKKPAKDTVLSFAATQTGAGKGFAIQEVLDQTGAFLGPVMLFIITVMRKNSTLFSTYRICFALLGIPAVVTVLLLFVAQHRSPAPEHFEETGTAPSVPFKMERRFVFYIIAISLFAASFIDFSMITMHTLKTSLIPSEDLPLLYAGAMAVDAFSALLFGLLFDKIGLKTLVLSTICSAPFAFFIFTQSTRAGLIVGVILWGIGMGAQESILKSAVTLIVAKAHRSTGFGIFQTSFGVCWFLGSALMGILYNNCRTGMVAFSILTQLAAIPFFLLADKR